MKIFLLLEETLVRAVPQWLVPGAGGSRAGPGNRATFCDEKIGNLIERENFGVALSQADQVLSTSGLSAHDQTRVLALVAGNFSKAISGSERSAPR